MLNKILIGTAIGAVAALAIVFGLLLSAKEDLGQATAAIDEAAAENEGLTQAAITLAQNRAELLTSIEDEFKARKEVQRDLAEARAQRTAAIADAKRRIEDATSQLTGAERACADSFIPQPLIDSLHLTADNPEADPD